ncbi:melatonin receptor type 1C-like [Montipora capricornis]|uniref:melatonin receptor type 1C-like n=1 Tax=Montipora capricornis TaxID=246305 RepID=UPI0035F1A7B1
MTDELSSRSLFITIVEVFSILTLNVFSLTGNTFVCIAVFKNVRLRSITNLYIVALAVSDLLSAIFVMPFVCGVLLTSKWVFGDLVCQFNAFFSLFVMYVSPVTMGLTAVNRYVRMCKPDEIYRKWFSKRKSIAFLMCVWIVVACYVAVPRFAGFQEHQFIPGYAHCSIEHPSYAGKMIHYCIVLILFFLTPLITTAFCYRKVGKMIRQHNENASTNIQEGVNTGISRHEINISKSLFAVVFAFMVCWVPFWILVILRRFFFVEKMPRNVELLCMFFLYLSNTINPFVYAGMNSAFRREFRKLLLCKRCRKDIIVYGKEGANTEEVNTHRNVADKAQVGQTTPL